MPRGKSETTRGESLLPRTLSQVVKRHATQTDLEQAQKSIGHFATENGKQSRYRIAGFRVDEMLRLIASLDLV